MVDFHSISDSFDLSIKSYKRFNRELKIRAVEVGAQRKNKVAENGLNFWPSAIL